MFLAKITGVIPREMDLPTAPVETREFGILLRPSSGF
jgi:hypothetical protein